MVTTWKSSTAQTRRLKLYDNEWTPSVGQQGAVEFLTRRYNAAIWADPGAGKTSITLTAFAILQEEGFASKMLVVAPLRVCQLVWRQEVAKWNHTRHLKVVLLHGDKKDERLQEDADIYLINYEGLEWLASKFKGRRMPWDVIVSDELTKLKNAQSKRFKAIKPHLKHFRYRWGLTGTPAPNGYLDLFGQFLFLDDGGTLGRFYTHYRNQYFQPGYDGFEWELRRGGKEDIEARIAPITYRLPYTDLPPFIDDPRYIELGKKERDKYKTMASMALVEIEGETVTAANAAAVQGKLRQMANGAVYSSEPAKPGKPREWFHIHDAKLDALEELVEELAGKPLLVAYSFHHDLERILARFGKDTPYLGSGVTEKRATEIQDAWNQNKIPILLCHPDSVGHGLNLQQGDAAHLCWFSADFNLELYDQFKRRIWRQGNKAERIFNHRLIVKGTVDELVYAALEDKDLTQAELLQRMHEMLQNDTRRVSAKAQKTEGEDTMPITRSRLPTQGEVATQEAPAPATGRGWGRPAAEQPAPATEAPQPRGWARPAAGADDQRATIAGKLQNAPEVEEDEGEEEAAPVQVFSQGLRARMTGGVAAQPDEPPVDDMKPVAAAPRRAAAKPAADKVATAEAHGPVALPAANVAVAPPNPEYPAHVNIQICGSPEQVRAALFALLNG